MAVCAPNNRFHYAVKHVNHDEVPWVSASEVFTSDADIPAVDRYESEAEEALDAVIYNRDSPRVLCNDEAASDKCCHNGCPPFCDCVFSISGMLSVIVAELKIFGS